MPATNRGRCGTGPATATRLPAAVEILAAASYYHTPGARRLAHAVKAGDEAAIARAAAEMAPLVPSNTVLVPVPGRTGRATVALRLAQLIAVRTGAVVADLLQGPERDSLYDLKRRGITPPPGSLGLRRIAELPPGIPILVDNVIATGTTAAAALAVVPARAVLVHSVATRSSPAEIPARDPALRPPSTSPRPPRSRKARAKSHVP